MRLVVSFSFNRKYCWLTHRKQEWNTTLGNYASTHPTSRPRAGVFVPWRSVWSRIFRPGAYHDKAFTSLPETQARRAVGDDALPGDDEDVWAVPKHYNAHESDFREGDDDEAAGSEDGSDETLVGAGQRTMTEEFGRSPHRRITALYPHEEEIEEKVEDEKASESYRSHNRVGDESRASSLVDRISERIWAILGGSMRGPARYHPTNERHAEAEADTDADHTDIDVEKVMRAYGLTRTETSPTPPHQVPDSPFSPPGPPTLEQEPPFSTAFPSTSSLPMPPPFPQSSNDDPSPDVVSVGQNLVPATPSLLGALRRLSEAQRNAQEMSASEGSDAGVEAGPWAERADSTYVPRRRDSSYIMDQWWAGVVERAGR
jgi:hypothetical protein